MARADEGEFSGELSAEQRAIVEKLGSVMTRAGAVLVVTGVVFMAYHALAYFNPLPTTECGSVSVLLNVLSAVDHALWLLLGLYGFVLGMLVVRATRHLSLVTRTAGHETEHLVSALRTMTTMSKLSFWVLLVSVIVLAVSFVVLAKFA